jgi:hexosaminidase
MITGTGNLLALIKIQKLMKNIFPVLFALLFTMDVSGQTAGDIIPRPVEYKSSKGHFILTKKTVIAVRDEEDKKAAAFLNDYLQQVYGFKLDIDKQEGKDYIQLVTRKFIQKPEKETYNLNIGKDGVRIEGDSYASTFYGIQTLIQLLPLETTNQEPETRNQKLSLPFVTIYDYPRLSYRGMHLDVARHFFPVSFVKRYIDYIALHKMNYFHWHLTDDQGWRIEIKKYPNLVQSGAWRDGTIVGRYPGTANDNIRYGGYYTQDEVREVVQYAADRHITVIPEIEMPGHASAAIASYPFLSCFPEQETKIPTHPSEASKLKNGKKVQETWGIFEDVFCAGNDSTFIFLEGVLDEVIALFPSQYIHAGGDECPKSNWKKCPKCQGRMKALGLKDEHELQSYFIQRMEKYLNTKGKILIGWDEILEGGLAPNAVVMSWRGEKGGIEAAKQNHKVIMTPQKPMYFDHTQTKLEDSLVFGGYNPLESVYAYEPVTKELDSTQAKFILGAQANLWTEYVANERKVEYMIFPRMTALSEVLWSQPSQKNWSDFEKRLQTAFKRYDAWKANYSNAYFDVKSVLSYNKKNNGLILTLTPRDKKGKIYYSINNSTRTSYRKALAINDSRKMLVEYERNGRVVNSVPLDIQFSKSTGKKASITKTPSGNYQGQGAFSLVNGIWSKKGLANPDWIGFIGDDIEATIDMGKGVGYSSVKMHTLNQNGSWIYLPQYVEVFVSKDGKSFTSVGKGTEFVKDTLTMGWITVNFPAQTARYIKVVAKNYGLIPEGQPGGGNKAWIFADEIQVTN